MKKQTYQFGTLSETIALNFLRLKGYSILKSRYKNFYGEIDIIARCANLLVFVEVKARKKNELIEVVLRPKQVARIKKSAEFFVACAPELQNCDIRFDFIFFNASFVPKHYEGFFE